MSTGEGGRRRASRLLRGGLLAAASCALCLAGLELFFRLSVGAVRESNVTPLPSDALAWRPFPDLRFVFRPGVSVVDQFDDDPRGYFDPGATLTYHINSLGFRGPETTLEKPAGRLRLAAVGDSVLFGTGVRDDDVLTAVLQRSLGEAGIACEVLNFGVPAYDTLEESVFLRRIALRYEPDLAFFLFFLNDTKGGVVSQAFNAIGDKSWLRRVSLFYDHLSARVAQRAAIEKLVRDYRAGFHDAAPGWGTVQRGLVEARQAADAVGVPLVLVIFPLLYRLDDSYPFTDVHRKVARRGQELGYHVLDLLPAFLGQDAPDLWVHPRNQHPNEIGHDLAGRAIARYLIEQGLLRER